MIVDLVTIANYAHEHWLPFMVGAIVTRPILCADIAFKAAMKTPFRHVILWNAPTINKWIDEFQAQFSKDVEEEKIRDSSGAGHTPQLKDSPPPSA